MIELKRNITIGFLCDRKENVEKDKTAGNTVGQEKTSTKSRTQTVDPTSIKQAVDAVRARIYNSTLAFSAFFCACSTLEFQYFLPALSYSSFFLPASVDLSAAYPFACSDFSFA